MVQDGSYTAESGGSATQAGIFYQNGVAALALAELLNLDQRIARERVLEVRLEAPEHVDDLVLRYADGHHDYQTVKLSLRVGSTAWNRMWQGLFAQQCASNFGSTDQLTIVVDQRNAASDTVLQLCDRAAVAADYIELTTRLNKGASKALANIKAIAGGDAAVFELLRRTRLLHQPQNTIAHEFGRQRLADVPTSPALLSILRDMAGATSRRRGIFRAAPLRRRLKQEQGILLGEPLEWGMDAYRTTIRKLARIDIPGTSISGPANALFVWPRARTFDADRRRDFEDERPDWVAEDNGISWLDLRSFPSEQFDRVVIVAGPGFGKSALLTAVGDRLTEGPLVPVAIPLASLAAADTSVVTFLENNLSRELDLSANWQLLAEQGLLVLLLDGLDEVPAASRPALLDRLSNFSARYPHAPWMMTVRDAAVLSGVADATLVELLPLNDSDIERFAEALQPKLGHLRPWELPGRLECYPDLSMLARIPLFLVLLLATVNLSDPKPLTRADLIETYLSLLFAPARYKKNIGSDEDAAELRTIAEALAFERLEQQEIGANEQEVRAVIARITGGPRRVAPLLERLRSHGVLKAQSAIRLQFPYPIVQEYLAAHHLVQHHPDGIAKRIEDAIQRPWAQVIQFALELHAHPDPVIESMLARPDDAFATGLRLVGRCIANGAKVSEPLRQKVGERLVEFWVSAPSNARERVGRLLADAFVDLDSPALEKALHHRWLMNSGAGEILSKRNDLPLTLSVLARLINEDRDSLGIHHTFKYAMRAAGDDALRAIIAAMDPTIADEEAIDQLSGLFWNFNSQSVSRDLVLTVARDTRLPVQPRLRAYSLAGAPLEEAAEELVRCAFHQEDWSRYYAASDLIELHNDPAAFFESLLRDFGVSHKRRRELAVNVGKHFSDPEMRRSLSRRLILDLSIDSGIRTALQLMEARHGDGELFEALVETIPTLPVEDVATTIALFGHHADGRLAERAAALIRSRQLSSAEIVRIASSVNTGMRYIFEMDWGFGGILKAAPLHAGSAAWLTLLEEWSEHPDLSPLNRLYLHTQAAQLGSEPARTALEQALLAIDDFDTPDWKDEDDGDHTISHALHQLRHQLRPFPINFIERVLLSKRYNIASSGVNALAARGDRDALDRLVALHASGAEWMLRDLAANQIELLAARLQVSVGKSGETYVLD